MHSRSLLFIIALVWQAALVAQTQAPETQNERRSILRIDSENDALVIWDNRDRYYTFGMAAQFTWMPERFLGTQDWFPNKKGYSLSIGLRSEGYTPSKETVSEVAVQADTLQFDRPFAGLLYGTAEVTHVFEHSFFRTQFLAGIMGPSAFAGEIQNWFHDTLIPGDEIDGWIFQIPDQLIVNAGIQYGTDWSYEHPWFSFFSLADARFGNLYTDLGGTMGIKLGRFASLTQSVSENNEIFRPSGQSELFFRGSLSATGVAFDGTAQGSLFGPEFEYAVTSLSRLYTTATFGVYGSFGRFAFAFDHTIDWGKVISGSRHIYARIELRYRF